LETKFLPPVEASQAGQLKSALIDLSINKNYNNPVKLQDSALIAEDDGAFFA